MKEIYLGRFMEKPLFTLLFMEPDVISHPWQNTHQSHHSGGTPVVLAKKYSCLLFVRILGGGGKGALCKLLSGGVPLTLWNPDPV